MTFSVTMCFNSLFPLFHICLLNAHSEPDPVPGLGDTSVDKTGYLLS